MDFSSVQGKVVIVTGASRGIGKATAEVFAENGMKVVCASRSADQGQAVVNEIVKKGGDAIFVQTDCSSSARFRSLTSIRLMPAFFIAAPFCTCSAENSAAFGEMARQRIFIILKIL